MTFNQAPVDGVDQLILDIVIQGLLVFFQFIRDEILYNNKGL